MVEPKIEFTMYCDENGYFYENIGSFQIAMSSWKLSMAKISILSEQMVGVLCLWIRFDYCYRIISSDTDGSNT